LFVFSYFSGQFLGSLLNKLLRRGS